MPRNPRPAEVASIDSSPHNNATPLHAALTMLGAVGCFAVMDAGLKALSGYPPFQVAAIRGAASLPLVLLWIRLTIGFRPLLRPRWSLHLIRGGIGIFMLASFAYGLRSLPLTTAYSIFFVAPLLIAALSAIFLKEHVGPRRWIAIAVGMLGVLVILRPTGEGLVSLGGLAVLGAALGYSVSAIMIRAMGKTESTQAMVVWVLMIMTLGAGLLAWPQWQPMEQSDWLAVGVIGVFGALGQIAITAAFRSGEASAIAPLEYSALAWGLMLDLVLWHTLPDAITWLGATIIVASGLYLLRRQAPPAR